MRSTKPALAGALVSGVFASACCIGPLVFGLLGLSGAAFAQRFEPARPLLLAASYLLLAWAFRAEWRASRVDCGPGEACERPATRRVGRTMLGLAALVVLLVTTFPWYSAYLF